MIEIADSSAWMTAADEKRKTGHAQGQCFARNFLDCPAGQEHPNVVQHGVQVNSKGQWVQTGVGIKRFSVVAKHHKKPAIDAQ